MWPGRVTRLRRPFAASAMGLLVLACRPSTAHAQNCAPATLNSCMTITFTTGTTTPSAADFANGVAVLGQFTVNVLRCGRAPCQITLAAQNQPVGGLRVRVGGSSPMSISDCPINLNGVSSPNSSQAPVLAQTSTAATYVVWVCQPLSWNPATTPLGTVTPEFRFRLRQG